MPTALETLTARRNLQLGVLNGLVFTLAETLLDPTLVLVAFVGHLTHSPLWLGLVTPLRDAAWFLPQLWVSGYLQSQPRKIRLYRWMSVVRVIAWAGLVLAVFFIRAPLWLLIAFFITYSVYALAAGIGGLSFLEVVGKTVPAHRRAAYFAWRLTAGGLAAIAEVFGDVPHQLCQFHVLRAINQAVLHTLAHVRKSLAAQKPKLPRGRPTQQVRKLDRLRAIKESVRNLQEASSSGK